MWIAKLLQYLNFVLILTSVGKLLFKAYYTITSYLPRKMPTTTEEIDKLKEILTKYYGVPDSAESWATILGHMCALPAKQIKMPYAHLANPAKRLVINGKLHEQKLVYYDKILKKHEKPAEPQPVTNVTPVTDETKQS